MFYLQICTLCTHKNIQKQNTKYSSVKMFTNTFKMCFLENLKPSISLKRTHIVLKIIIQKNSQSF
ncbi:rCG53384 [Rattus norvegicus]|uniref:RCG53384 n=1 Tax=Rattus norvegicus TaxID=10116 RepID=A6KQA6_RAT|nr:rCG53384 [Rattus norvegicus]